MAMDKSQIEQAISSFEDLGEVLSKLISPIHGVSPLYLTTKDLEVISASRSNLHRYLIDTQAQLTTEKAIAETPLDDSEDKEPGVVQLKAEEIEGLRSENEKNLKEIEALQNALRELHSCGRGTPGDCQTTVELMQTKQELNRCKETLQAMKTDRRRLKSDKVDLVSQMKQLYHTLEDKESELREFIRNYEQRMNEISAEAKKMEVEKEEIERTKNAAMDECRLLKEKLEIVYRQPKSISNPDKKALNNAFVRYSFSDDSVLKRVSTDGGQCSSSGDDLPPYQDVYVLDMSNHSPVLAPRAASVLEGRGPQAADLQETLQKASQLFCTQPGDKQDDENAPRKDLNLLRRNPGMKNATESPQRISKVLRPTPRNSTIIESQNASRVSFLSQENYEEKLKTVSEARELPVKQWRANHVLSWLELEMNMTNYASACADNIKSGKVLLGLSDAELESALRLQSPLHRRKLRLAIEELRDSSAVQFPVASKMSHVWVSQDWIVSLGLAQYSRTFEEQLIDGRLLNVLTKKDLYKYLKIHKKFHQMSITYGVELLRSLDFDKDRLQGRRVQSREHFSDPLVWSNEQVIEWANHIDLSEYSHTLKETGVHGAVLVLDQGFTSDVFASMLGIPSSKSYVRRHLSAELEAIIRPARAAVEESRSSARSTTANSSFGRSFSGGNKSDADTSSNRGSNSGSGSGRKLSFRGSLGRAFGRRPAKDLSLERPKEESGVKGSSKSDLSNTFSSSPLSIQ